MRDTVRIELPFFEHNKVNISFAVSNMRQVVPLLFFEKDVASCPSLLPLQIISHLNEAVISCPAATGKNHEAEVSRHRPH
ncbi:hypothetical protein XELAEV_18023101mg [Xenopus laevis]|uniref:Uncharacterized protein n=1 Tax=Xenopus laevis TaxID=8355 RepID=A0A974D679_XENLA|nr:hypothetical protein XELAEV_18023101mg [Xenopus laevis]